jgi:hypothetical protein
VENKESLKSGTLIGELSDSVEDQVHNFFTNGVVTPGVVIGGIFFTGDKLFWAKELSVSARSDLVDNGWLQINENGSWNVFTRTSLREKGVETVVAAANGFIAWHLSVWLDTVLEAVELPTSVSDLNSGLADVDRDAFSHFQEVFRWC